MPNPTDDLADFLNDDSFQTPLIRSVKYPEGKVYTVESPNAEDGLRMTGLANIAAKATQGLKVDEREIARLQLDDDEERTFMQQVLGKTYQEMLDDGVKWITIQRLNQYAFAFFAISPQSANRGVESGAFAGKAPAPANRTERRAKKAKSPKSPVSAGSKKPKVG